MGDTPADLRLPDDGTRPLAIGAASRRLVTVLFADVVGSTSIGEQLDPERFAAIQARMFAAVRPVIERHGGTVEKFIGDAVMAVFGLPTVREDDALRAARAALELSPSIATLDADLHRRTGNHFRLRVGPHSGEVLASGGPARSSRATSSTSPLGSSRSPSPVPSLRPPTPWPCSDPRSSPPSSRRSTSRVVTAR